MPRAVKTISWLVGYVLLIASPLAVGVTWPAAGAGRPFWLQFGAACGFVAFSIMAFEFALISKVRV